MNKASRPASQPQNSDRSSPQQAHDQNNDSRSAEDPGFAESALSQSLTASLETVKSVGRLSKALLTTPLHFSMGIARGFQNIPIAYGDTMVRRPGEVSGVVSGVEVGFKVSSSNLPILIKTRLEYGSEK
jgi:hypothetical protein